MFGTPGNIVADFNRSETYTIPELEPRPIVLRIFPDQAGGLGPLEAGMGFLRYF